MRAGDLVRFQEHDHAPVRLGLLLRYDKLIKVAEIQCDEYIFYAPGRLVEVSHRGYR